MQHEFVFLQGCLDAGPVATPSLHLPILLGIEEMEAIASTLFCDVHRLVCMPHQRIGVGVVEGVEREADAGGNVDGLTVEHIGLAECLEQALYGLSTLIDRAQIAQQQDELVTAKPADSVVGSDVFLEALRHHHQQLVAGLMAECVVDRLEVVEVEVNDGEQALGPLHPRDRLHEAVGQQDAVRQLGQCVMVREELQFVLVAVALRGIVRKRSGHEIEVLGQQADFVAVAETHRCRIVALGDAARGGEEAGDVACKQVAERSQQQQ